MSLTSSAHSLAVYREKASDKDIPFHRQPSYITLSRTLTRLSNSLIPLSPSNIIPRTDLTPDQQLALRDLLSPLPYHRTRTLHTIEHARTLLLQLEQSAQNVKIQRVKKDVVRDLAEKRKVIRKLRAVVEELRREAERREREGITAEDGSDYEGETVEELLGLPPLEDDKIRENSHKKEYAEPRATGTHGEDQDRAVDAPDSPKPPTSNQVQSSTLPSPEQSQSQNQSKKEALFNLRHRRPKSTTTTNLKPTSSTTTTALETDHQTQASLTTSLLNLATQLKTQSQTFSETLTTTDKSNLDRALRGLDSNVSGLESASSKMGLLRRMSEGEGLWGRILLYLWIWALWAVAVLLVFVGPKLRF
jgi:hypothetical protein